MKKTKKEIDDLRKVMAEARENAEVMDPEIAKRLRERWKADEESFHAGMIKPK